MSSGQSLAIGLLIYFGVLLALSRASRRHIDSRTLMLFRALFPSWRFFEDLIAVPVLEYRYGDGEQLGNWLPALRRQRRSAFELFLNPHGNLQLAQQGIVQQVEADIGELEPDEVEHFESSVSFQLARRLVEFVMAESGVFRAGLRYQFRAYRTQLDAPGAAAEPFLLSQIYEVP